MGLVYTSAYTKKGEAYEEEKRRNYFKAENLLILKNLGAKPDSIKATVKNNGELEKLVRVKNGKVILITKSDLSILTLKQNEVLFKY